MTELPEKHYANWIPKNWSTAKDFEGKHGDTNSVIRESWLDLVKQIEEKVTELTTENLNDELVSIFKGDLNKDKAQVLAENLIELSSQGTGAEPAKDSADLKRTADTIGGYPADRSNYDWALSPEMAEQLVQEGKLTPKEKGKHVQGLENSEKQNTQRSL